MAYRQGKQPVWSQPFAYCVGLIVSDGNLSSDGRHLNFTSKDRDLVEIFKEGLGLAVTIDKKARGGEQEKKYFRVQFGNIVLYEYLVSLGITPKKSLTIGRLDIPTEFFWDFLRGCIDGDGNISITKHPESKHLQLKVRLHSGSKKFLEWIRSMIFENSLVRGGWIETRTDINTLVYAKSDGIIILKKMYKNCGKWYLARKKAIADRALSW